MKNISKTQVNSYYTECCCSHWWYAKCRYAKCHYAQCRGALCPTNENFCLQKGFRVALKTAPQHLIPRHLPKAENDVPFSEPVFTMLHFICKLRMGPISYIFVLRRSTILARDKHFSLLGPLISCNENEVL
jgi:hypothetical protein